MLVDGPAEEKVAAFAKVLYNYILTIKEGLVYEEVLFWI